MRAPLRLNPTLSKAQHAAIRKIERDFHVREFGEELARVNLDMTMEERLEYIDWMREMADKHGVPRPKKPFDDLEKEAEEIAAKNR